MDDSAFKEVSVHAALLVAVYYALDAIADSGPAERLAPTPSELMR